MQECTHLVIRQRVLGGAQVRNKLEVDISSLFTVSNFSTHGTEVSSVVFSLFYFSFAFFFFFLIKLVGV